MADQIDYAAALAEMGYDATAIPRMVRIMEAERDRGDYRGFRASLRFAAMSAGARRQFHDGWVEPVIRRVEAQEAAATGRRSPTSTDSPVDDVLRQAVARETESSKRLAALGRFMESCSDEELDGRVPLRRELINLAREAGLNDLADHAVANRDHTADLAASLQGAFGLTQEQAARAAAPRKPSASTPADRLASWAYQQSRQGIDAYNDLRRGGDEAAPLEEDRGI